VAADVDALAKRELAEATAPLPRLRWMLAVELITSGAAFTLFQGASDAQFLAANAADDADADAAAAAADEADDVRDNARRRLG
jgi:hypothetical protein